MTNLFSLMEERGLKPTNVATEIGCSPSLFSEIKKGQRMPSADILMRMASYFDCSVDYLLDIDDVPNRRKGKKKSKK